MNAEQANPSEDTEPASAKPKRRRLRWWYFYLPLLIASFVSQMDDGRRINPPPDADYLFTELQTQRRSGPITPEINPAMRRAVTPEMVGVAYRDAGPKDAPVVVLLHGSPGSSGDFTMTDNGLFDTLVDQGYRVIAPDLPGFGYSDSYVPDYSNRAHARYVLDLLDECGVASAHFLGFSMGGGVCIQLYDIEPDRVESITMLAAIGVQEAEGSGDYHFEHLKYGVGYLTLVGGVEFIPHFGLLGDRSFRHAWLRNFWDTDQRPNREILERFNEDDKPMLIVHGEADPLAPPRVAYDHHEIVEHSELLLYKANDFKAADGFSKGLLNHAMVFTEDSNENVLKAVLPFLDKHRLPGVPAERSTLDRSAGRKAATLKLPGNLELRRSMSPWVKIGVIMLGTFTLEDPTSIAVGLFIKAGQIDPFVGAFAVLFGIFLGDFGLYMIGYFVGRPALRWRPIAAWVPTRQVEKLGDWFDKRGWKAVLASRFIPGSRMPLYIAAGVTGSKPGRFMLWTFMAVCIWVPIILFSVFLLGDAAREEFQALLDKGGWLAFVGVVLVLMIVMNVVLSLFSRLGRRKMAVRLQKQYRYEYWPAWKFYPWMVPYWLYLVAKFRSWTLWTLANPCMPDGGVVGESKCDILSRIDDPAVLDHVMIKAADDIGGLNESEITTKRIETIKQAITDHGWSYPLILKPDAAQRGAGVTLIETADDIVGFVESCPGPAQLQQYHPGPLECGVFYTRLPSEENGSIFSITDKVFPVLVGDGRSNLEELIWKHPRFRFQHDVFHIRFANELDRVLDEGEELRLAMAGNHCQGTLFRDGAHLITPVLEARIDELCKKLDGFYFGRIDIRYTDEDSFKRGENFAVIEFNGVTSESTNLYDPDWSLWQALAVLRRQWKLCFEIGKDVRETQGLNPERPLRLLFKSLKYYRGRHVSTMSD